MIPRHHELPPKRQRRWLQARLTESCDALVSLCASVPTAKKFASIKILSQSVMRTAPVSDQRRNGRTALQIIAIACAILRAESSFKFALAKEIHSAFHAYFTRISRMLFCAAFSSASKRSRIEFFESTAFRVRFYCPVRGAALFILRQDFL